MSDTSTTNQQETSTGVPRVPRVLFAWALAASAALVLCLNWSLFRVNRTLNRFESRELALERTAVQIDTALLEARTAVLRYAETSNDVWADLWAEKMALTEEAIRRHGVLSGASSGPHLGPAHRLRANEAEAIELVREGLDADARAMLSGPDHLDLAAAVRQECRAWADVARQSIDETLVREQGASIVTLAIAGIAVAGIVVTWIRVVTHLHRHICERSAAERELETRASTFERQSESLRRIAVEAASANRIRSDFLARMSRELRTPLQSILGLVERYEGPDGATSPADHDEIIESGNRLRRVVDDLLEIATMEAGELVLTHRAVNLPTIIASIVEPYRILAEEKGLQFDLVVADDLPRLVEADPDRLRQIITHLVENAIRFTDRGSVDVRAGVEVLLSKRFIRIDVNDTGIGLDDASCRQIFEPFRTSIPGGEECGPGLGLAVARRLARRHEGEIEVDSRVGEGSHFIFRFPAREPESGAVNVRDVRDDSGDVAVERRVLLAEDGPAQQRLIATLLRNAGAEITVVGNGREALDAVEASGPFDLVVMDMQMPQLDGFEATRRLRASGYVGPIVALTAHATDADRRRCLDCGCDGYVAKPVDHATVREMLQHHVPLGPVRRSA